MAWVPAMDFDTARYAHVLCPPSARTTTAWLDPAPYAILKRKSNVKSRPRGSRVAATQGLPARSVLQLPSATFPRQRAAAPAGAGSLPLESLPEGQRCHRPLAAG